MKIDFGKLTPEETKTIAVQALNELTIEAIHEVLTDAGITADDLRDMIAKLEADDAERS